MSTLIKKPRTTAGFAHERTVGEETWLTPRFVIDAVRRQQVPDIDPCSSMSRPWPTAKQHFNKAQDGFNRPWSPQKFYWVNPPYGRECAQWVAKAAAHRNSLVLVFARTDTQMFHRSVWGRATAVFFFAGRLKFCTETGDEVGTAGAPSVLIAYGATAARVLAAAVRCGDLKGHLVALDSLALECAA